MLELDLSTLLFQIVNFLILAVVLGKFIFKPARRLMHQRTAELKTTLDQAAQDRNEADALHGRLAARLKGVEEEAKRIVRQAREESEQQAWGILRQAQAEADALRAETRAECAQERAQAVAENYDEMLDTIVELAALSLQGVATQSIHDDLVARLVAHIWELGRTDRQRVEAYRRMMAERQPVARVHTPLLLSEEQQHTLADTLSALVNRTLTLTIETDPTLIAGLKVRLGDSIVDHSLQRQLLDLRDELGSELERRLRA